MLLDENPVLHDKDEATHFSAARYPKNSSTEATWNTIILCCVNVYTDLPQTILVDRGSNFGKTFADIGALNGL